MEKSSAKDFDKKVLHSKKLVLVEFMGKDCAPCQQMVPVMKKVMAVYKDKDYIEFFEVDTAESPELVGKYGVMSIPHITLFYQGKVIDEIFGRRSEDAMKDFLKKNIVALKRSEFFEE